jgi:hypothetical protein
MTDGTLTLNAGDDVYTLLGVRRDGVASVVDLVADDARTAHLRAEALLREHASCEAVEVWREGGLVEKIVRN